MEEYRDVAIRYIKNVSNYFDFYVLDQTKLPDIQEWHHVNTVEQMWTLIKDLSVRGAPLIGVAAVLSLAVEAQNNLTKDKIIEKSEYLKTSRPTAVNLMTCCDIVSNHLKSLPDGSDVLQEVRKIVHQLLWKEVHMNDAMAKFGASLIQDGENILTHCNTGSLATPGKGTALGVIKEAHAQGKKIHVYVDETRPLLQGGRLTAYELKEAGIPYTIICDNMAATLMRQGKVQRILVGSDRIAVNGDFANKIGTYSLAVLANYHKVPFHTVAPLSTVDLSCASGEHIPIEERAKHEVLGASAHFGTVRWAPEGSNTYNPAFDVTPVELVTSIILDSGIYTREQLQNGVLKSLKNYAV